MLVATKKCHSDPGETYLDKSANGFVTGGAAIVSSSLTSIASIQEKSHSCSEQCNDCVFELMRKRGEIFPAHFTNLNIAVLHVSIATSSAWSFVHQHEACTQSHVT